MDRCVSRIDVSSSNQGKDFGLLWVYIGSNMFAATFLYWLLRTTSSEEKRNIT
ncbi:hypothetical protein DOTSEDRAFT_43345 [Dothistroma septosporum NZE10]|uniref:CDR ABC transporter domain-containing protein n=1 Tax=Dothistroma septosporum (strain NZE10 / CBS 128990) TaxID=675120 RepID=N1PRA3_DOTSN|nr:hypothetical protein DOTSEDRAFT_43345 [Dothistroma septosporum NZE10]